ncbi:MAG TPA: hypothetical protein VK277_12985 [Acidimicrobiales bacterium]|nr:hypothetical protein [Acidimicrobiales bacterium]
MSAGRVAAGGDRVSGTDRWRLLDERDFLLRSLADADAEHDAGDLSDEDHRALRRRDEARLATVVAELVALEDDDEARSTEPAEPTRTTAAGERPATTRRRPFMLAVGLVAVLAGLVLLLVHLVAPSAPGQPATGSIKLNSAQQVRQQLAEADQLNAAGDRLDALTAYQKVLAADPEQPEALARAGWLEYELGAPAVGQASVAKAVAIDPGFSTAHLYLGIIDWRADHDASAAVIQFKQFLSEHPAASVVASAATFLRQAFTADGQPVPKGVPAG